MTAGSPALPRAPPPARSKRARVVGSSAPQATSRPAPTRDRSNPREPGPVRRAERPSGQVVVDRASRTRRASRRRPRSLGVEPGGRIHERRDVVAALRSTQRHSSAMSASRSAGSSDFRLRRQGAERCRRVDHAVIAASAGVGEDPFGTGFEREWMRDWPRGDRTRRLPVRASGRRPETVQRRGASADPAAASPGRRSRRRGPGALERRIDPAARRADRRSRPSPGRPACRCWPPPSPQKSSARALPYLYCSM